MKATTKFFYLCILVFFATMQMQAQTVQIEIENQNLRCNKTIAPWITMYAITNTTPTDFPVEITSGYVSYTVMAKSALVRTYPDTILYVYVRELNGGFKTLQFHNVKKVKFP